MRQLLIPLSLAGLLAIPRPARAQHAFDDLPIDDPSKRSILAKGEDPAKKIRDNIFIVASVDHPECYQGQQIRLTYKLYTALQSTTTITAKPIFNGFVINQRRPNETPLPEKTVDGRRYHGFAVWEALLTPLQPGEYTIDPLKTGNDVSYSTPDGRTAHYSGVVASRLTTIHVLPLPAIDRPPAFSGLVGKWQIQSRLAAPHTDSSGNDTLLVEITGSGSFQNLTAPYMRWPAGFRHMEPIQRWEITDTTTPQSGRTIIAIPFTASIPGQYSLPPMELAWFDPVAERYHTKRTDSLIVHVLSAPAPPPSASVAVKNPKTPATQQAPLLKFLIPLILVVIAGVIFVVRRRRTSPPGVSAEMTPAANPPSATQPVTNAPIGNAPVTNAPIPDVPIINAPKPNQPAVSEEPPTPLSLQQDLTKEDLALADIKQTLIRFLQSCLQTDSWAEEDILNILQQKDPSLAGKARSLLDECNQLLYSPLSPEPSVLARLNRRLEAIVGQKPL
ncbi:MAG TPA: hypothetical protein VHE34_30075 [Puia sp.]|uniref:hypothetical protein n=1 Tax=Puia sp. TaxID=2045100 RepID=UPI002D0C5328|nr:hypothetical protein [Puia sp.]HVU99521.1 hypothetical protein [Puia sp.]